MTNNKRAFVFPPSKILVPLDLTEASRHAWRYAKELAASFGAGIEGLYVKEWLLYGQYAPMMADVQPSLAELRRSLGAGDEVKAASGTIEGTILSWSRQLDFDLVVMGSHARNGFERLLRGSIAEAVVRFCEIPVLVTRREHAKWRSVLAPVNFQEHAMRGLTAAAEVALSLNARLTALHVVDAPLYGDKHALEAPRELLDAAVAALPASVREACKPSSLLVFGDPVAEISKAAADHDLVVLAGHHKGTLEELMLGETTQRLLRRCDTPLLVLPSRAEVKHPKRQSRATAQL